MDIYRCEVFGVVIPRNFPGYVVSLYCHFSVGLNISLLIIGYCSVFTEMLLDDGDHNIHASLTARFKCTVYRFLFLWNQYALSQVIDLLSLIKRALV